MNIFFNFFNDSKLKVNLINKLIQNLYRIYKKKIICVHKYLNKKTNDTIKKNIK